MAKSKKRKQSRRSVSIPGPLHERLVALSAAEGVTISSIVSACLSERCDLAGIETKSREEVRAIQEARRRAREQASTSEALSEAIPACFTF